MRDLIDRTGTSNDGTHVPPDTPWPGLRSSAALLAVSAFWLSLIGWTLASAHWLRPVGLALLGCACLLMWRHALRHPASGAWTYRRPPPRAATPAAPEAGTDPTTTIAPVAHVPPDHWHAGVLRSIEWRRFEAVCEALFRQDGHRVSAPPHHESGIDLVLHSAVAGDRIDRVVQCLHWSGSPVGLPAVRALRGAMADLAVDSALFVANATFAPEARAFAQRNGITVVDGTDLLMMLVNRPELQQRQLLAVATQGEYWRPTCARCGAKMLERHGGPRGAWDCSPPCTQQLHWPGEAA